jgi:hypothetical protein
MWAGQLVFRWIGVVAFVAMGESLHAAELERYGTFVYSSLCLESESGDIGGFRTKLMRSAREDSLFFEWSEGPLYGPMLASKLIIDPKTSRITFTIPALTPPSDIPISESYSGEISDQAIVLKEFGYGDQPSLMPYRSPALVPRVHHARDKNTRCKANRPPLKCLGASRVNRASMDIFVIERASAYQWTIAVPARRRCLAAPYQ